MSWIWEMKGTQEELLTKQDKIEKKKGIWLWCYYMWREEIYSRLMV